MLCDGGHGILTKRLVAFRLWVFLFAQAGQSRMIELWIKAVHIIAVKAPNMQKFIRTLKRGDAVDVTYTESLAVNIVPSMG